VTNNSVPTLPPALFPWQAKNWQTLWQMRQQNRLAHGLLFVGMDGIGKRQFAQTFAYAMLCSKVSEAGVACSECSNCHLLNAGTHPDLVWVEPAEVGKKISVDQVRDIIKNVNETSLKGGYRLIIINPASAMNVNAANALLKTLEEPAPNTLLILISNPSLRLPATIISRCQKIIFNSVDHAAALTWLKQQLTEEKVSPDLLLKLAHGAPLRALALVDKDLLSMRAEFYQGFYSLTEGKLDPVELAAKWYDTDHISVVDLLLSWLTDLLRYKMTTDPALLTNTDYKTEIMKISVALLRANLLAYIDEVQKTRAVLLSSINLNKQLVLEDLFIRWAHYVPS
jgi:DNA polymerase III subunit delta'